MPGTQQIHDQDLNLKRHLELRLVNRPIDVTERVMSEIKGRKLSTVRLRRVPQFRYSFLIITVLVVGLLSFTTYSASKYLRIQDSKGNTLIQTQDFTYYQGGEVYSRMLTEYMNKAQAGLKPGQMAAYYIADKLATTEDHTQIRYVYNTSFSSYENYEKEARRTNAPQLLMPSYLPPGYKYFYSDVTPKWLILTDAGYKELLDRFTRAAQAKPDQKLFVELVDWKEATASQLVFTNGTSNFGVVASKMKKGGSMAMSQSEGATSEIVSIGERKAIYVKDKTRQQIGWVDDNTSVSYMLTDSANNGLSKQELVKVAASFMSQLQSK